MLCRSSTPCAKYLSLFVCPRQSNELTKDTVDVPTRPHILRAVEINELGMVVIEGSDAAWVEEQVMNIAHNPLPTLDHNLYWERFYRGAMLHCRVCGRRSGPRYMVLNDHGYQLRCLEPMLDKVLDDG